MIDTKTDFFTLAGKRDEQLSGVIERIYSAAQPGAVFSEPVKSGNYTVIMASEVAVGGGFGSGSGLAPQEKKADENSPQSPQLSGGSGIGGGGGSSGRPVAIIVIGPDGVTVKPIFDITKIALAGITAWGTMLMLLRKMRSGNKR